MKEIAILLDIESVLDTRYGRLVRHNPKLADEVLFKFNEYCSRDHDNLWLLFPEITEEAYNEIPNDVETLKASKRTNIFNVVDDLLRSVKGSVPEDISVKLILNTTHYDLTEEALEAFLVLISARYEHNYKVTHVSLTQDKLTPNKLVELADVAIFYDINGWIELHHEEIPKVDLSKFAFYIPTLFMDKKEANRGFFEMVKRLPTDDDPLTFLSDYIWEEYRLNIYFISNRFYSPISLA